MPTRQEKKAARKEKRAKRRAFRIERRSKIKDFSTAAANANFTIDLDNEPQFVEVFNQFWPVVKPALEFVILLPKTKEEADKVMNVIIQIGDRISTGNGNAEDESMFVNLMESVWAILKPALELIQMWTDDNVDDTIDDIIEIGEYIMGKEEDD